jgi:DNA-binding beta-propeller fold protein YncE
MVRLEALAPVGRGVAWPSPPESPRVRHLTSFRSARDLGFRRSFLRRLTDAVRGQSSFDDLRHPYAVAVTESDLLYVVDSSARGVHSYDLERGRYRFLSAAGLMHPVGVAVGLDGRIYVSDSEGGVVVVMDPDGEELDRIREGLKRPTGIAVDPSSGHLLVVDTEAHQVRVFTADGAPLRSFGRRGIGEGAFNYPTNVAVDLDGRIYVSDSMNFRVQILAQDGTPLGAFGRLGDALGDFARPKGIGVDTRGRIFVVEGLYDVVNIFDPAGRLLLTFGGAGQGPGNFWLAAGIAVDARGRVFVADSYNGRVQVFQLLAEEVQ